MGLGGGEEVGEGVADGDGLDGVVDPLGGDHGGEAFGEVADHLEGGGAGADDGPGAELGDGEVVGEDAADLGAAGEVGGGVGRRSGCRPPR